MEPFWVHSSRPAVAWSRFSPSSVRVSVLASVVWMLMAARRRGLCWVSVDVISTFFSVSARSRGQSAATVMTLIPVSAVPVTTSSRFDASSQETVTASVSPARTPVTPSAPAVTAPREMSKVTAWESGSGAGSTASGEAPPSSPSAASAVPPSRPIAILSDNSSASIPRSFFLTIFSSSPFHGMISRQGGIPLPVTSEVYRLKYEKMADFGRAAIYRKPKCESKTHILTAVGCAGA